MITYKFEKQIEQQQLVTLYDSVGWLAYTKEPIKLSEAVKNSLVVISAWEKGTLIGLIRAVGDGQTIIYIQDLLVMKEYQGKGLGSTLMQRLLNQYPEVRQKVLLTNETPTVRNFYEQCGFVSCDKGDLVAFFKTY
ncbi:hypothetical protein IGI37_003157 [Enterococcus sp. AZ194]|uniref:GNAT family N-acetyltransferase n=1 Tax=Enterococcus sp. AZ194 TaxID=2774629 RepID=UPI003F262AF3